MKKSLLLLLLFTFGIQAQNFWTEVAPFPAGVGFQAEQISIVDADVVWVNGYDYIDPSNTTQMWSRSIDSGITWISGNINLGDPSLIVSSIHAISATTAYVSAVPDLSSSITGGVWITQDAGVTWTKQTSALYNTTDSFANFIHFYDSNNGIVVGDPESGYFEIYITSDAGLTWVRVPQTSLPALLTGEYGYNLKYETRNNSIWFGTNKGRIFKSSDLGVNWTVSQSPLTDFGSAGESGDFAFRNENEGLLVSHDWGMYRTYDAGNTWVYEVPQGIVRNFNTVFVPQTNNAYFSWGEELQMGMRGSSYSTNGGMDWIDLDEADAQPVNPVGAEFQSGTVGFCIGYYHLIGPPGMRFFKLTDPLFRFLNNNEFENAAAFSVYPNPTNGMVKISGANINSIKIYDVTGKEVLSNIYNSIMEVSVDVSRFQNGIYIAKITSDSGTKSIVKIVKN